MNDEVLEHKFALFQSSQADLVDIRLARKTRDFSVESTVFYSERLELRDTLERSAIYCAHRSTSATPCAHDFRLFGPNSLSANRDCNMLPNDCPFPWTSISQIDAEMRNY